MVSGGRQIPEKMAARPDPMTPYPVETGDVERGAEGFSQGRGAIHLRHYSTFPAV